MAAIIARSRQVPRCRAKVSLGAHQISHVIPSPDGALVLAVSQHDGTVLAFDARTLESKWTFSSAQMQNIPSFSPDGSQLVYLSTTGAAVLDARTGEVVLRRCGVDFQVRGAPPFDADQAIALILKHV